MDDKIAVWRSKGDPVPHTAQDIKDAESGLIYLMKPQGYPRRPEPDLGKHFDYKSLTTREALDYLSVLESDFRSFYSNPANAPHEVIDAGIDRSAYMDRLNHFMYRLIDISMRYEVSSRMNVFEMPGQRHEEVAKFSALNLKMTEIYFSYRRYFDDF